MMRRIALAGALIILAAVAACSGISRTTVLFLGDSNTQAEFFVADIAAALEITGRAPRLVVRGVGGETVSGLIEAQFPGPRPVVFDRLARELRRWRPDWVVIWYGMNDGLFQPFDAARFDAFLQGMDRLADEVLASGAKLIVMTPPPFARPGRELPGTASGRRSFVEEAHAGARAKLAAEPTRYGYYSPYEDYDSVLAVYADAIQAMAGRDKVWVVDVRTALQAKLDEAYGEDPVHPNRAGHKRVAEAFLKTWETIRDGR